MKTVRVINENGVEANPREEDLDIWLEQGWKLAPPQTTTDPKGKDKDEDVDLH